MVKKQVLARLSNCGKILRAFATASALKSAVVHQGNDLGYGNNAKDWTIRSQVLMAERLMDSVQRLDGSRSSKEGLRYSLALQK
jgi:hypothetical protein